MQLGLGSTSAPLQDGFASWNASAADAADIWDGYLDFISISSVSSSTVPQASGDGVNSVFFSNTILGERFEAGTLAFTLLQNTEPNSAYPAEADIIVNEAFQYDSYRGPEQTAAYDFHRIMLHELGHVLGLGHVTNEPPGQAMMEPIVSDLDHLASDDILGVKTYRAMLSNIGQPFTLRVGDPFAIPVDIFPSNNDPTSYSVTGLPPGITFDPASGEIEGTATGSGVYGAVVTAHGPFADAYGSFPITVYGLERVPGLLKIVHAPGALMVVDPIRPRVYTGSIDGLQMIDTESFEVTNLLTEDDSVSGLSISLSADASLLLFTKQTDSPPLLHRIDLKSLALLPPLTIPASTSPVLEGSEDHDYVSDTAGVYQFNRTSGELQASFAPTGLMGGVGSPEGMALSPDRRTLYVTSLYDSGLRSYDISGHEPLLLQSVPGSFKNPIVSPDGQYLYYASSDLGSSRELLQAHLPDLFQTTAFASNSTRSSVAVGLDGSFYQALADTMQGILSHFQLYDPVSLQQTADIDVNRFGSDAYHVPGLAVFDSSGKYLLVSTGALGPEVWVFSTQLASYPPAPADPTKNLLNISTRARVETGEDAMIGGFIVQGPNPKKILIRGVGPSLLINAALSDPVLDLFDSAGKLLASNDDWVTDRLNILGTQLSPTSPRDAAVVVTLSPGAYTVIVHDKNDQPGLGLIEAYDMDPAASLLGNISTRGKVGMGDDVMIGGFIIGGAESARVLVRALGPSLGASGVRQPLLDPVLELHDADGKLVSSKDNWRATQSVEIAATGLAPTDDRESALLVTLLPGNYTAIVRGQGDTTGVALIEIYNLDAVGVAPSKDGKLL